MLESATTVGNGGLAPAASLRARRRGLPGLAAALWFAAGAASLHAQDTTLSIKEQQIEGPACAHVPVWQDAEPAAPCRDDQLLAWVEDARHWRAERRVRTGADDREYRLPALKWTQSSYVQPQMMVHDRYFYDPVARRYTVGRYLDDLDRRYGGIDSVLVWPTYPNLGVDDRNQYDLLRDVPGGIAGVRSFVDAFHARGVRVLFPTMVWDQGTRDEGTPDPDAIARELKAVGADGINGDTLAGVPRSFRVAADAAKAPLALEPELGPASDEMLNWNAMSWGYWDYSFVPVVSRFKWLEPRHLIHISNRFAHAHVDDLQHAFLNGVGFESWENVWGIWNGITPRDAEALRRVATIERATSRFLVSPAWRPFYPTRRYGVFASEWPDGGETLWTLVNRSHYAVGGAQLDVPARTAMRYFDLWHGAELQPRTVDGRRVLSFDIEADGYGAILATAAPGADIARLLARMRQLAVRPLADYSPQWAALPQTFVPTAATAPADGAPPGMSRIPAADFTFRVNGIEIEGGNDEGTDVQYPGEPSARRYHDLTMHVPAFWIDTFPVTNAEFKRFLDATRYRPADDRNFLKDWTGGTYPDGWARKPVTWVSIEDARAYARWAAKRLPHEWEWQYAAQGTDGRTYPWGDAPPDATRMPAADRGRRMAPPGDVDAHPAGASPLGVHDLVGNVWQMTDEVADDHSRFVIVRGGSHYRPAGARWYFPQAYKLSEHGKYLLMAPGIDRSGAIGFRCAKDAAS